MEKVQKVTERLHRSQRSLPQEPEPVKRTRTEHGHESFFQREQQRRLEKECRDKDAQILALYQMLDNQILAAREEQQRGHRELARLRKAYEAKKEECAQLRQQLAAPAEPGETQLLRERVLILEQELRRRLQQDKENNPLSQNCFIGDRLPPIA
jgi:hypothetical protein